MDKKLIKDFVDWAINCGEDMSYIFDETDDAIDRFIEEEYEAD